MKDIDKNSIVDSLLELARKTKLNKNQKNRFSNIVDNLENATETQKERFIMYYGLNTNGMDFTKLSKIAQIYGCTTPAIRNSIITLRNKLSNLEDDFYDLEELYRDCALNIKNNS